MASSYFWSLPKVECHFTIFLVFSVNGVSFHLSFEFYYVLRMKYHNCVNTNISVHVLAIRSSVIVIHVHHINWQYLLLYLFIQSFIYLINTDLAQAISLTLLIKTGAGQWRKLKSHHSWRNKQTSHCVVGAGIQVCLGLRVFAAPEAGRLTIQGHDVAALFLSWFFHPGVIITNRFI